MSADDFIVVNSATSLLAGQKRMERLFAEHHYVTFTWRIGPDRSLPQNSLLHVWLTEYAAHLLNKDKRHVTDGELEGMKRHAKRMFYNEPGERWMVQVVKNPARPEQRKNDFTSSRSWKRGEMFQFLTWLQATAAGDGLVLESKGEYAKLQREQNA